MQLELTTQEAVVLTQLLDAAVKANGLNGAEAAVVFAKRLQAAAQAQADAEARAKFEAERLAAEHIADDEAADAHAAD